MFREEDLIPISSLQHYIFCPRQCALILVEQLWEENYFTAEGRVLHTRVHAGHVRLREEGVQVCSMPVRSLTYGIYGVCDVVVINDYEYLPVEYKRGRPKTHHADEVQLCAQVLCVEEMKDIHISKAYLYYYKIRHRVLVEISDELRAMTKETIENVHALIAAQKVPPPVNDKTRCTRCSLKSVCLPSVSGKKRVEAYLASILEEERDKEGGS
ncbi:CRISPR-associated protein Cas4 [Spirochaeta thermophila]|uniref:CRISPR-associated exonuclease Cas4 n=1 Tax=Winmispira thermophila (strain ATCC 49972 / DSM 6192 / RI 19.B1) TaxID=665571 RepID=E0RPN9_WINT6|nr:CRISPR-associated protein Cas4 [Spirochaeta thermophila]ADN01353.1 hypothetical protein STHERM_c03810 [Spirochaeta thermophila DSM 6192]